MEDMLFRMSSEADVTAEIVEKFLKKNLALTTSRYDKLGNAYKNDYDIFHLPPKPPHKPDNRIAVNFAKYITDTMNGFFMGIPVKITAEDERIQKAVDFFNSFNDVDDHNAELSKICSIYGRAYEMYFVDEDGNIGMQATAPDESFIIYDNSILNRTKAYVRYYKDTDDNLIKGSVSDNSVVRYFNFDGSRVRFVDDEKIHGFDGVPAVEYVENKERMGIYESAMSQINAFNKALSEKANDVDYFADAYMKILGPRLDESEKQFIRENRIINFEGYENITVDFMAKPNADTTQENLINRLERLIFITSMVANVSDEQFGTASGIALKYRMLSMNNLAQMKERKFTAGFNKRYKLVFSNPILQMAKDDWLKLSYQFARNYPVNLADEADTAGKLSGITSKRTQLSVISAVKSVDDELEQIQNEQDLSAISIEFPTERTAE